MDSESLQPLYVLLGTSVAGQLIAAGFGVVRWMAGRSVTREDEDKKEFKERIEELEKKHLELDRSIIAVVSDIKQLFAQVDGIRGAVAESKAAMEGRFDKQADFYRAQQKELIADLHEKLEKLEFSVRQDTTRAIHDAQSMQQTTRKPKRGE